MSAGAPPSVTDLREHQRRAAETRDVAGWPPECLESERRFGHRAARLYPLIGVHNGVRTPRGIGTLVQAFSGRCLVLLLKTREATLETTRKKHVFRPMTAFAVEEISPYRKGAR